MPHAQVKSGTSASAADVEAFLQKISHLNIEGVSGTSLEADGLVHMAVGHGHEAEVHAALAAYHPKWTTDVFVEEFDAQAVIQPGRLHGIVQRAKAANPGRAVDTVLTGVRADNPAIFYVQVTFVGADWSETPPPP